MTAVETGTELDYLKINCLLKAGIKQAAASGNNVLVSYSQTIPCSAPLAFFGDIQQKGEDGFYWERPSENIVFAGAGAAYEIKPDGFDRFLKTSNQWKTLLDSALIEGENKNFSGPILTGGFSFEADIKHKNTWEEFGASSFLLPQLQITNVSGGTFLTLNAVVLPDSDIEIIELNWHQRFLQYISLVNKAVEPVQVFQDQNSNLNTLNFEEKRPADLWKAGVAKAVKEIQAGKFQKVVLAREVTAVKPTSFDTGKILEKLAHNFPDATIFAFSRKGKVFLGASPERLAQLSGGEVKTAALAGSIRRGSTPEEDQKLGNELINSQKNQAEHAVVSNIIFEALKKLCNSLFKAEPPRLLKLKNVQHLYTPIVGRMTGDKNIFDLVAALHPTPALGGYPRQEALKFIRENEDLDRGWYGAPVGWINCLGEGEFVVGIRSALLKGNEVSLYAGCGIVEGSTPEGEYQESCFKLGAMLSALEG